MKKRMASNRKRFMCGDTATLALCLYVVIMITLCLYLALES